jgi:hypothetical protein
MHAPHLLLDSIKILKTPRIWNIMKIKDAAFPITFKAHLNFLILSDSCLNRAGPVDITAFT